MMKPINLIPIVIFLAALMTSLAAQSAPETSASPDYQVGRGIGDITGPAFGVQMWGYSYDGQLTEGIHTRQKSRAFIISQVNGLKQLVFVSADIGSIEHNITLEVVDKLQALYGNTYTLDNVMLSATHSHSGPGGYWHNRTDNAILGPFYREYFDGIVNGIVASITQAHDNLQAASILINKGEVEGAGINRSLIAYRQNPKAERAKYPYDIDKDMTLLKFTGANGDMGLINWYAVHPTSMTYYNRLISGDHKGYGSLTFEQLKNEGRSVDDLFVAAFAQSYPGDVTPNLNLDNTGPGADDFDSTRIIGERQLSTAVALFEQASERVHGKIDYKQLYVDLSDFEVEGEFTGSGSQRTCPSAYGYAFAGGSSEDGGGHFLFEEGMTEQSFFLDFLIRVLSGTSAYTEEVKACQAPKAILWQTGTGSPPLQSQIRSISVARIGQLVIIAVPAEFTTMAGRRLREAVMAQLGGWAKYSVIAGYSNGYAGYVTTPEEYRLQQYEGGHTLHGQWTLAAYLQATTSLAKALESRAEITQNAAYIDWRGKTASTNLADGKADRVPRGAVFGQALAVDKSHYRRGDTITVDFWSSNPTKNYGFGGDFLTVEQKQNDTWDARFSDADWSTKISWQAKSGSYIATLSWEIPDDTQVGQYRLTHSARYTNDEGLQMEFTGNSPFEVGLFVEPL